MSKRAETNIVVEYAFGDLWEPGKTRRMTIPFSYLTPLIARIALEHAPDLPYFMPQGMVWWPDGGYGYRVYRRAVRKLYKHWNEESG